MTDELVFPDGASADAWGKYISGEKSGDKRQKMQALSRFISILSSADAEQQAGFVDSWCRSYLDGLAVSPLVVRNGQWMRLPLFQTIFAPVLEHGRSLQKANHARWSAQLYGLFCMAGGSFRVYEPDEQSLLEEALQRDPHDGRARALWLVKILSDINYFCHELPGGLLADPDYLNDRVGHLEELFEGTIWQARSLNGLVALRKIARGDWSERVLIPAFDLIALRHAVERSLFPETGGEKFQR